MSDVPPPFSVQDIGDYCRRVEDHLTRVNAGHLVRIVGAGFDLVRGWAESGVPLSVVFRGIEMKAERHREGASKRPLRIEFCEPDVRAVFDNWRRAVGFATEEVGTHFGSPGAEISTEEVGTHFGTSGAKMSPDLLDAKRPSLSRHLDRAIDRLSRAAGHLDWPAGLRDECDRLLQTLVAMRSASARARGAARDEFVVQLPALDAELAESVRVHAPASLRTALRQDAEAELAPYQPRLSEAAWRRSVDVTTDRLLRDRLGLPVLEL